MKENEIIKEKFSLKLKRDDFILLDKLNWLNDEIINFYLNLIVKRYKNNDVHTMNTFFYYNLEQKGFQSVKTWTGAKYKKTDIFKKN